MTLDVAALLGAFAALVTLIAVFVRVGNVSGRFEQQIAALEKDSVDARADLEKSLEAVEGRIRRELGEIKQLVADLRREMRENNAKLEERWIKMAERVTGLEEWRRASRSNGPGL